MSAPECRECGSDLIGEEAREGGGYCLGCAPSCGDCGAVPALLTKTKRGKPFPACQRCVNGSGPILSAVLLDGERFDWQEGAKAAAACVREDGEVDWRAAYSADPGVTRCPKCGTYHWREGTRRRCAFAGCGQEWGEA